MQPSAGTAMSAAGRAARPPSSAGPPGPEHARRSRYDYENFSQFRGRCNAVNEPIFAAVPPRRKPGLAPSRRSGGPAAERVERGRLSEIRDSDPVYSSIPDTGLYSSSGVRKTARRDSLGLYKNQLYAGSALPECRLHLGDEPRDTDTDTGPDPEDAKTPPHPPTPHPSAPHPPGPHPPAPRGWMAPRTFWLGQLTVGAVVLMLFIPLLVTMATRGSCQACETKELRDQLQFLQGQVGDVATMVLNMQKKYGKPEAPPSLKPAESRRGPDGLTATGAAATRRPGPAAPTGGRLQPEVISDQDRIHKEWLNKGTNIPAAEDSVPAPAPTTDTPAAPLDPGTVQGNGFSGPGKIKPLVFPPRKSVTPPGPDPEEDPDSGGARNAKPAFNTITVYPRRPRGRILAPYRRF
ncbi:Hypp4432 [Branchiostoma lanceolatum]|uniref:Hypp4432 protein n=1 Tax=Branchiostoma lanceolatum TaxID=7740 RepID=A0A8K0A7L0_BRALA|nr:Hypp4432 [Branchiostoma lanceolatum]